MPDQELQVNKSYTIPGNARRLVLKEKGVYTKYTMLISGNFDVVDRRLQSVGADGLSYKLFLKLGCDIPSGQGNITSLHVRTLMEYFKITKSPLYKAIGSLVRADLMRKVSKGKYKLNPHVFWSGKTTDRIIAVEEWDSE